MANGKGIPFPLVGATDSKFHNAFTCASVRPVVGATAAPLLRFSACSAASDDNGVGKTVHRPSPSVVRGSRRTKSVASRGPLGHGLEMSMVWKPKVPVDRDRRFTGNGNGAEVVLNNGEKAPAIFPILEATTQDKLTNPLALSFDFSGSGPNSNLVINEVNGPGSGPKCGIWPVEIGLLDNDKGKLVEGGPLLVVEPTNETMHIGRLEIFNFNKKTLVEPVSALGVGPNRNVVIDGGSGPCDAYSESGSCDVNGQTSIVKAVTKTSANVSLQVDMPVPSGQSSRLTAWKAKARLADLSIPPTNLFQINDVGSTVGAIEVNLTPVEEDDGPPPQEP
uniref:Uncharacterized protein n=1 Tax=Cannabis sativa TaxID=3483 RepID=A0A803QGQ6_CANSA